MAITNSQNAVHLWSINQLVISLPNIDHLARIRYHPHRELLDMSAQIPLSHRGIPNGCKPEHP
jgi:hypothetical protein